MLPGGGAIQGAAAHLRPGATLRVYGGFAASPQKILVGGFPPKSTLFPQRFEELGNAALGLGLIDLAVGVVFAAVGGRRGAGTVVPGGLVRSAGIQSRAAFPRRIMLPVFRLVLGWCVML